ncbi:hypothetical protein CWB80_22420, partial [Pseudoalteromonas sp. S1650]
MPEGFLIGLDLQGCFARVGELVCTGVRFLYVGWRQVVDMTVGGVVGGGCGGWWGGVGGGWGGVGGGGGGVVGGGGG